jgi:hypothetical protein
MIRRILELHADGYVRLIDNKLQLTDKGWRVLAACADRPIVLTNI